MRTQSRDKDAHLCEDVAEQTTIGECVERDRFALVQQRNLKEQGSRLRKFKLETLHYKNLHDKNQFTGNFEFEEAMYELFVNKHRIKLYKR